MKSPSPYKNLLLAAFAVAIVGISLFSYFSMAPVQKFGNFSPTGAGTYLLQSSISSTQSSITLTSFTEPSSNIPYTLSYLNSDIEYGTINPSSGNSEFVSFTGISQNSNGTATLTGLKRGLSRTPGTGGCMASTTLAHAYPGQTQFILSNSPCFYSEYYALRSSIATSTGILVFSSTTPPRLDEPGAQASGSYIATTSEFATVLYVNNIAIAGVNNATELVKGIVQLATGLQAASSTSAGSTGARLVLPASIATDTPMQSTASASKVIMSDLTGYLKQSWLNLAQNWAFTATTTFATSTYIGSGAAGGLVPPGSIVAYASSSPPAGWLLADGSSLLRASYPELFRAIGTTYGSADGSHFTLPDLRNRKITMASSTANLGQSGGEANHALLQAEIPNYNLQFSGTANQQSAGGGSNSYGVTGSTNIPSGGSGTPLNVLDPYFVLEYIIKY